MADMESLIRLAHNRYFDQLKSISDTLGMLKINGSSQAVVVATLERQIKDLSSTFLDCGKQLVETAQ